MTIQVLEELIVVRVPRWRRGAAQAALMDMEDKKLVRHWQVAYGFFHCYAIFVNRNMRAKNVFKVFDRHMVDAKRRIGIYAPN